MAAAPQISIVTPSFRSNRWLPLAIASVADQAGVTVEHIVQDAGSDDGTLDWLPHDRRVRAHIERDQGMYDAVNRGLRRAQGEILAYLNADEQYLPGALRAVADFFAANPAVEVVFADAIIVDSAGQYLCSRQALRPLRWHTMVSGGLAILTCATFFRRRMLERDNLYFDVRYRILGDARWVLRLLEQRVRTACLPGLTSVFTDTGENLSRNPSAQREKDELLAQAPWLARALRPAVILHHRWRRLLAGHYSARRFSYAIFTTAAPGQRVSITVPRSTGVYRPHQSKAPVS